MLGRTLFSFALSIPAGTVRCDWIDGAAATISRHYQNWSNIRSKGLLQNCECFHRITLLLCFRQCLAVDEMSLNIGSRQFDRAHHERLYWIGDIVGLIEHVGRIEIRDAAEFC